MSEKVVCKTPSPGKKPTRIDKWKYDLIAKCILGLVPHRGEGILFKDLPQKVQAKLSAKQKKELGSIAWYTTCVKLHLEVIGEIRRVKNSRPQRLLRGK